MYISSLVEDRIYAIGIVVGAARWTPGVRLAGYESIDSQMASEFGGAVFGEASQDSDEELSMAAGTESECQSKSTSDAQAKDGARRGRERGPDFPIGIPSAWQHHTLSFTPLVIGSDT
jgi:hypothetical protein